MRVLLTRMERKNPEYNSMALYARHTVGALRSIGVRADERPIDVRHDQSRGGTSTRLRRFITEDYRSAMSTAAVSVVHAVEYDVAYRGVDVVTVHDLTSGWGPKYMARIAAARAEAVVAPSRYVRRQLMEQFALPRDKVFYVPTPRPIPSAELLASRGSLLFDVVWVGNNLPRKNALGFLHGLRGIPSRLDVAFVYKRVGDPKYAQYDTDVHGALLALHTDGVHNVQVFDAPMTDDRMRDLYLMSGVVVSTSTAEGFHMPPWEGYAHGCRVVVPGTPGYTLTYDASEGVSYFGVRRNGTVESLSFRDALLTAVFEASEHPPLRRCTAVVDDLSYESVGRRLYAVYQSTRRR